MSRFKKKIIHFTLVFVLAFSAGAMSGYMYLYYGEHQEQKEAISEANSVLDKASKTMEECREQLVRERRY